MSENSGIIIKGIKNGILVEMDAVEEWLTLTQRLSAELDEKGGFYRGAQVTMNFGDRPVSRHQLTSIKALLEKREMSIWSVMSDSATTIEAAHTLDLKTNVANTVPQQPEARKEEEITTDQFGVVVRRTLRSGQRVQTDGHAVIIGDVNPGAQVIAGGDIIVWGRLRGTVHAGKDGDDNAVVCALDMSPTQLRIAEHIVTSPDAPRRQPQPETALIRNNQIIVESWR
ncbi:MAG: septum site-determining protein MinC [Chloroflexota bacterium]